MGVLPQVTGDLTIIKMIKPQVTRDLTIIKMIKFVGIRFICHKKYYVTEFIFICIINITRAHTVQIWNQIQ